MKSSSFLLLSVSFLVLSAVSFASTPSEGLQESAFSNNFSNTTVANEPSRLQQNQPTNITFIHSEETCPFLITINNQIFDFHTRMGDLEEQAEKGEIWACKEFAIFASYFDAVVGMFQRSLSSLSVESQQVMSALKWRALSSKRV